VKFKQGLLDGDAVCYVGKIKTMESSYAKGERDGSLRRWDRESGKLNYTGNFNDGLDQGLIERFEGSSGKPWQRINFKDGKQNGLKEFSIRRMGKNGDCSNSFMAFS
jgi:antitoxin component YwqK of YwqJK toxin-antitoxin module